LTHTVHISDNILNKNVTFSAKYVIILLNLGVVDYNSYNTLPIG